MCVCVCVRAHACVHVHVCMLPHHPVGLVVNASASRAEDIGFDSCLHCGNFSGSSHTSDLKIATPVASLPHAWQYRVSAGTGWPGVSIL